MRLRLAGLCFVIAALAACGGGGGGGGTTPAVVATATPTPVPTTAAVSIPIGTATTAPLGSVAGESASLGLGAPSAGGGSVTAQLSLTAPGGAPTVQSSSRLPKAIGTTQLTTLLFISITPSATLSFTQTPTFTFVFPAGFALAANTQAYIAMYDPTAPTLGWQPFSGPGTVSGTTITVAPVTRSVTFQANQTYYFVLFTTGVVVGVPTAAPSPTASPAPTATATSTATPTPTPTATGATVAAAPAVGYLATTSTGALAGRITSTNSSVTVIGMSQAQAAGSSSQLPGTGSISYADTTNSPTASIGRLPAYVAQSLGLAVPAALGAPEGRQRTADEERALRARLRPASAAARSAQGQRQTQRVSIGLPTTLNASANIWVSTAAIGTGNGGYTSVPAHLQYISTHGNIWVADTLDSTITNGAPLSSSDYAQIGAVFENAYTSDTTHFASPVYSGTAAAVTQQFATCDTSGTPIGNPVVGENAYIAPTSQIAVFVVDSVSLGSGVGGYFDSANYVPQAELNCLLPGTTVKSNETAMIFVGFVKSFPKSFEINQDLVRGTAHEFQHLINFANHILVNNGTFEDSFINEGLSMLAQDLAVPTYWAGQGNSAVTNDVDDALIHALQYLNAPQNFSITAFSGIDSGQSLAYNCSGCYGAEYLLQRYLYDRFNGDTYTHSMEQTGTASYANIAAATGQTVANVPRLFTDFAIALAASNTTAAVAPYQFSGLNLRATYTSPNGQPSRTLNGPTAVASLSGGQSASATGFLGGFFYLSGSQALSNTYVSLSDPNGAGSSFKLAAGIVQR